MFLMLSWILLPPKLTRRHYLSVCLVIGAMSLEVSGHAAVSLGALHLTKDSLDSLSLSLRSQINAMTRSHPTICIPALSAPGPAHSSSPVVCQLPRGVSAVLSIGMIVGTLIPLQVFIRTLSMHLQICWDVTPGHKFFYLAQGLGWGLIAALFTPTITVTGVSFRFGDACHVNSSNSMADFWGPLLGISGASAFVQITTFGYCINVYLKNLWSDDETQTQSSSGLPSYTASLRTRTNSAKAVYRRVKKVVWLQWRGIVIVVFILIDVIFFSVVFVYLDARETSSLSNPDTVRPWVTCLVQNPKHKEKCFDIGQHMLLNQGTVTAILVMLSVSALLSCVELVQLATDNSSLPACNASYFCLGGRC